MKQRQKLIKLADSSVAGWRVVDEYVKNPIASDSAQSANEGGEKSQRQTLEAKEGPKREIKTISVH